MIKFKHYVLCITCAIFVLCMMGCNSKRTPINRLENLTENIQNNAQDFTEDDWKATAEELELIENEIEQYKSEYTDEELKEIGRLKGKCLALYTKYSFRTLKNDFEDIMKEAEGILDGFKQELEDIEEE